MRSQGRNCQQIRQVTIVPHFADNAAGSVLLELGKTKILAAVSLTNGVPPFLRGKNQGWLTASYALLPLSCAKRVERESCGRRNDRAIEISRLIGRSLRSIVNLEALGEKTIAVDCDVLQADGGTRAAAITAACYALTLAQERWLKNDDIKQLVIKELIAAISVGVVDDIPLLDLDYEEDMRACADFNFIMTNMGGIVELQGTAEKKPIEWNIITQMKELAQQGIAQLFTQLYVRQQQQSSIKYKISNIVDIL